MADALYVDYDTQIKPCLQLSLHQKDLLLFQVGPILKWRQLGKLQYSSFSGLYVHQNLVIWTAWLICGNTVGFNVLFSSLLERNILTRIQH